MESLEPVTQFTALESYRGREREEKLYSPGHQFLGALSVSPAVSAIQAAQEALCERVLRVRADILQRRKESLPAQFSNRSA